MHDNLITPQYGPLAGVRVLLTGVAFAGPYAARWMGDMGAEIIKVEIPVAGDTSRLGPRLPNGSVPKWLSLARNMNSFEFNMNFDKSPASREVFIDLIKQCDIWINSVPNIGKHGPNDALCHEVNPKLVIVHISGYGLKENGGSERYLGRPCVDPVGQAFSGLAGMQGMPDGPFLTANPLVCDITTSIVAVGGALAAYINAQKTGKGQVVDAAMYESAGLLMNYQWCEQLNMGRPYKRSGPLNPLWKPFGYYKCGDGNWVSVGVWGLGIWKKYCGIMGVSDEDFPYMKTCGQEDPALVEKMDKIWQAWLAERSADEVEDAFLAAGIPVSKINSAQDAFNNPHWKNRGDFITMTDPTTGDDVIDFATVPRFGGTPANVYKAGPLLGQESDAILSKILGYSDEKIKELKEAGAVAASLTTK